MIVVHHLNESRSQRVLWLLEELGVPYEIETYERDAATRLAPPELFAVHPLGKSPVVTEDGVTLAESGAIVDHLIRRHGKGRFQPAVDSADYDRYVHWLHYAEGSAMLPLMLQLYIMRIGEAGAPLQPRIDSELANHLGYIENELAGRQFFVGDDLTGADVQMTFVLEVARMFGQLQQRPNSAAYLDRMHARPAFAKAIERGGPYMLGS
ncbi:MAG TPA: glutathione S-transferase [Candidatus Binatia bacterium]|jgi:glutathione S-transferase|nr:glutathione S-transferase [Candidatus Binatia bacterium]